jgi:hypothetical protein
MQAQSANAVGDLAQRNQRGARAILDWCRRSGLAMQQQTLNGQGCGGAVLSLMWSGRP